MLKAVRRRVVYVCNCKFMSMVSCFSSFEIIFTENTHLYDDFYEELDNRVRIEPSMNVIFFGPSNSFLRLDPESILHIFVHTKKHLIPITRVLLAWDVITGTVSFIITHLNTFYVKHLPNNNT